MKVVRLQEDVRVKLQVRVRLGVSDRGEREGEVPEGVAMEGVTLRDGVGDLEVVRVTVKLVLRVTVAVGVRLCSGVRLPEAERVVLGEGRVRVGVGVAQGVGVRVGVADMDRDRDRVAVGERWESVMGRVAVMDVLEVRELRVGEEEWLGVGVGMGRKEAVRECVTILEALWLPERVSELEGSVGL